MLKIIQYTGNTNHIVFGQWQTEGLKDFKYAIDKIKANDNIKIVAIFTVKLKPNT